jgi:hypothetical protein
LILLIAILGGLVTGCVIIAANGGFMPISPQTASRLVSQEFLKTVALGKRNGNGKDILLLPANTRLVWLSTVSCRAKVSRTSGL